MWYDALARSEWKEGRLEPFGRKGRIGLRCRARHRRRNGAQDGRGRCDGIIGDVLADSLRQTASEISNAGGKAFALALDVTSEAAWAAAVAEATKQFGKIDILVNNAGMLLGKDLMDATMEDWNRLVAVNMMGVWLGTKVCAPALAETGRSSRHGSAIVNLSSRCRTA